MPGKSAKAVRTAVLASGITLALALQLFSQTVTAPERALPVQVLVVRSGEEARKVLDRLRKGDAFSRVAKEVSIDPTAADNGFLGTIQPDALRPELRDALKGLGSGQLSSIVPLTGGYAILRIMPDRENPGEAKATPSRSFALSAEGVVRYVEEVHGLREADAALTSFPKPPGWNADPKSVCEYRKQSLSVVVKNIRDRVATTQSSSGPPMNAIGPRLALGELYSYQGEMPLAIEQYEAAYRVVLAGVPGAVAQIEEILGIAYLHLSEMENGVYRDPGDRDLFPMHPASAFKNTTNLKKSIAYFQKYLDKIPDDLEVKWLLTVACMDLGGCPADVPAKDLIAASVFASKEDVGRFVDVAVESGLKLFATSGGVIADDFQNDGLLDIVTSAFDSCGEMHYFRNQGDGTFTDRTAAAGLTGQPGALNLIQGDYNNDGCIDILALRGAWEFPQRKSLLRNNCDGTFTDVTVSSGLGALTSTQTAVWADINNDGLLDLFVGNENGPPQMFLNKGDGTFQDIAVPAGLASAATGFTKAVAAGDFDNDGYVDFYVSNLNGPNVLYHNNGDKTFTDVTSKAGVPGTGRSFGAWFFDYDNDGLPDLFVTSYFASVDETARSYLGLPHNGGTMKLYRNLGDGTFRDVTAQTGLDKSFMPMGANFGDIDNDGYLDIYLGTGNPSYASVVPNVLLRNHEGKYFVDVTTSSGTGSLHKGHAIAFADLGNNGNDDIVADVGGATIGDSHAFRVFRNPGHSNDWVTLKLVGSRTNRSAIGARIKVTVENRQGGTRSIFRTVGSGGAFGASPLQQHIGLGSIARIAGIEVYWPVSKTRQTFSGVDKNQFLQIEERNDKLTKLDRKPFQLGAARSPK